MEVLNASKFVLEGNKSNTGSPAICACDHTATCESPCSPIIGA